MPLIEELPTAKSNSATPGWAYVPDTGYDPSKAPIVPSGARSRNARKQNYASSSDTSARQQQKIDQHLALLDRENHKDVQIVVPGKAREGRGLRADMTPGVRKILTSNKTFANHLADEEAAIALKEEENATRSAVRQSTAKLKRQSLASAQVSAGEEDVEMSDVPPQQREAQSSAEVVEQPQEEHPLLRVNVPPLPTPAEIEALLSAPPLSYNAARAAPSTSTAPPRQFCEMCGYWGRARCMKCGVRVCSLECQRQHDDSSCQKFWA